jgi:hypothetical protein
LIVKRPACYRALDGGRDDRLEPPPDVERVSGQWVVNDTRILAQGVIDNADDFTAEESANEIYEGLGTDRARRIIDYARRHVTHPHPA